MKRMWVFLSAAVLMAACSTGSSDAGPTATSPRGPTSSSPIGAGSAPYSVTYRPDQFSPSVTNPWFPLVPGTTLVYRGRNGEERVRELFTISHRVRKIDGVPCRVVLDRLYAEGALAETTADYYTQDVQGNVWYFGEDTAEIDQNGSMVSTEGTWHAGEAGALPGMFMPADPQVGERHRQEYYAGHAEDFFQVADLTASVTVPDRSVGDALLTKEWTPLEPGVLDHKYYARGIGELKEVTVKGPLEELVLVAVRRGG